MLDYRSYWNSKELYEAIRKIDTSSKTLENFEKTGKGDAQNILPLVNKDDIVLDIGCGIGRVGKWIAPHVKEYWGIDISETMIEYVYLKDFNNVFLKVGNGRNLSSFKDSTFDLVYSFIMLQHLERYITYTYLIETYRILKSSGRAFINLMLLNDLTWGPLYKTIIENINNDNFYISDFLCVANP